MTVTVTRSPEKYRHRISRGPRPSISHLEEGPPPWLARVHGPSSSSPPKCQSLGNFAELFVQRCRSDARPRRATTFGRTKVASRDIATGLIIHFMEIRWENVDEGAGISVGGAWPGTAYFARNLAWPISSQ